MPLPAVDFEIVLRGSDAVIRGRCPGTFVTSIYRKHEAALAEGTHADATMQGEYVRMGGRGLLCRVFEAGPPAP